MKSKFLLKICGELTSQEIGQYMRGAKGTAGCKTFLPGDPAHQQWLGNTNSLCWRKCYNQATYLFLLFVFSIFSIFAGFLLFLFILRGWLALSINAKKKNDILHQNMLKCGKIWTEKKVNNATHYPSSLFVINLERTIMIFNLSVA